MSRSRELEQFLSRREQGRKDQAAMFFHIMGVAEAPQAIVTETAVISPVESKFRPYSGATRILLALGVASALNLAADRFNTANAKDPRPTATVTATATPTSIATRTTTRLAVGTAQAGSDSRVVVSEDGRSITIENINTNTNTSNQDLISRIIDFLRNPSQAPVPAAESKPLAAPLPIPHPTPTLTYQEQTIKDLQDEIQRLRLRKDKVEVQKEVERLEQQLEVLRNPLPTPDKTRLATEATITREALATAGRATVEARIAGATASVPAPVRTAQAKADKLAIQQQAAEMNLDNKKIEDKIKELEAQLSPTPTPKPAPVSGGGFPWLPLILVTGGVAAIYAFRTRIPVVNRIGIHIPGPHF